MISLEMGIAGYEDMKSRNSIAHNVELTELQQHDPCNHHIATTISLTRLSNTHDVPFRNTRASKTHWNSFVWKSSDTRSGGQRITGEMLTCIFVFPVY